MSWYNTGYQANLALAQMGQVGLSGWRGGLTAIFGLAHDPSHIVACVFLGFLHFLPIYLVTLIAGGLWEVLFAVVRRHEINEGFLVTSMLYTLTLPPDIPLWLVALGISFGVVIGKEIFGGTGKNFLNPALTGRAFLYFAYPAYLSGDAVWVAVDGYSSATALGTAAISGMPGIAAMGYEWSDAFLGLIPGSLGETSTLACLLGAAFLVYTRIASYRVILGVFFGMVITAILLNWIGSDSNPMFGDAVVLASGSWRFRVWHGFYGNRPGVIRIYRCWSLDIRPAYRYTCCFDTGRKSRFSGRDDVGDFVSQYICTDHRLFCSKGEYQAKGKRLCEMIQSPRP